MHLRAPELVLEKCAIAARLSALVACTILDKCSALHTVEVLNSFSLSNSYVVDAE